jgi:hypothetical protein
VLIWTGDGRKPGLSTDCNGCVISGVKRSRILFNCISVGVPLFFLHFLHFKNAMADANSIPPQITPIIMYHFIAVKNKTTKKWN